MKPTKPHLLTTLTTLILTAVLVVSTPSSVLGADSVSMFRANLQHTGVYDVNDRDLNAVTWVYATGSDVTSSPAVTNGIVYVGSYDNNLYALNATTGTTLWNYTTGDQVGSSPAIANGIVYVGSSDNNLYALNATTGTKLWNYTTGDAVQSSPAVSNGIVYVGSSDNNLYAIGITSSHENPSITPSVTAVVSTSRPATSSPSTSPASAIMPLVNFEVSVINFFVPGFEMLTEIIGGMLG